MPVVDLERASWRARMGRRIARMPSSIWAIGCVVLGLGAVLVVAQIVSSHQVLDDADLCANVTVEAAIAACTREIASGRYDDDDLAKLYYNRGVNYHQRGDDDRAIADFTAALHLAPEQPMIYNFRGLAWQAKREYDRAVIDYGEAMRQVQRGEFGPRFDRLATLAEYYTNRGGAWVLKGDIDRALKDLDEAIRLDPKNGEAFSNRGLAYYKSQQYDRSIADYDEAIRLDPDDADLYGWRSEVWVRKGDYAHAFADYEKALQLNPARADRAALLHRASLRVRSLLDTAQRSPEQQVDPAGLKP
jgi:Tfp pilus assembly protein PilF